MVTNGSFAAPVTLDNAKEVGSHFVVIPAATNAAQTINPIPNHQGATIYNMSGFIVRALIVFVAGITAVGAAATCVVLIPPNGTYSFDFSDHTGDNESGNIAAIDQITLQTVTVPAATAEGSTLTAPAAIASAANVIVNFISA